MDEVLRETLRMQEDGRPGVLAVVVSVKGHAPQVVGAKMVVDPDGRTVGTIGGGRVEQVVIERALAVLESGQPEVASYKLKAELGMCCGGQMDIYLEPLVPAERLVLFGAGHVAKPVAHLAARCRFQVVVVDDRAEWNTRERFPEAARREVMANEDFLADFAFRPGDYVVITTPSHDQDREVLAATLGTEAGYVGMIGSRRKVERTKLALKAQGIPDELLARAHAPIGLDILAETPEEIAVAIVGELIRHRHRDRSRKKTRGADVGLTRDREGEEPSGDGDGLPDGIA
jgi:xanthine dehydrogenase accessory factor